MQQVNIARDLCLYCYAKQIKSGLSGLVLHAWLCNPQPTHTALYLEIISVFQRNVIYRKLTTIGF